VKAPIRNIGKSRSSGLPMPEGRCSSVTATSPWPRWAGFRGVQIWCGMLGVLRGAGIPDREAAWFPDLAALIGAAQAVEDDMTSPEDDANRQAMGVYLAALAPDRFPNITGGSSRSLCQAGQMSASILPSNSWCVAWPPSSRHSDLGHGSIAAGAFRSGQSPRRPRCVRRRQR
jgi:hypothetical protein